MPRSAPFIIVLELVLVVVLVLVFLIKGMSDLVIKAVIEGANRLLPLTCEEVEDENDDEDEDD